MILFPFYENRFSFFAADYLLVSQLCTNPKSDRSLLSIFNEQDQRCTAVQLMPSTDPNYDHRTLPAPSKCKSDGSTLEGTAQHLGRPFGGGGAEAQSWGHRQEDPDHRVHRKGPGNHWCNSPAAYSADCLRFRRLTHNCECMCEGGLEV